MIDSPYVLAVCVVKIGRLAATPKNKKSPAMMYSPQGLRKLIDSIKTYDDPPG
tara:strand:+ start:438 stop:596 length:159 start_codon:yes stop_codon:yes gene_type:complete